MVYMMCRGKHHWTSAHSRDGHMLHINSFYSGKDFDQLGSPQK